MRRPLCVVQAKGLQQSQKERKQKMKTPHRKEANPKASHIVRQQVHFG